MYIVKNRKIFYTISAVLMVLSIGAMAYFGFKFGMDFKGGSLLEVSYVGVSSTTPAVRPSLDVIHSELKKLNVGGYSLRAVGDKSYSISMTEISPAQKATLLQALSVNGANSVTETQFSSIGPLLGKEARNKSIIAIILVLIAIVLFIAFAFRHVSKPVSSWIYGLVAVVGLIHNIILPAGIFAIMGHFYGTEIDTLFVTALLVILGFSIHDTIVVFDRIRENLRHASSKESFEDIVGKSTSQTFTRSINTSVTVLLSLVALYFLGSESTHNFVLALIIGIAAGAYSSIFIGSPLLVTIQQWQNGGNKR
jgi:preprotein translocase subunit SecF